MNLPHKLVFVDLETTGANPHDDRITEIGVVTVENGVVSQWSSLVNPQVPISPFIEELTGINDGMVRDAPLFGKLAQDLMARLEGGLFIAHNAKFDYSFLRNAFQRVGMSLKSDVLCTVKLSRKLYPDEVKHNLGALIERHALLAQARHRALADADVLWQFWQKLQRDTPAAQLDQALKSLLQKSASPSHVEPDLLQGMPNGCGVYLFHDAAGTAIFVGKASHLRRRAQGHFNSGDALDQALAPLVKRVTWHSTTGDIGASLLEAKLLKDLQPPHNRHMRVTGLCSWRLANENSAAPLTLVLASELDFASATACYGLFRSRKKAEARLREVAAEHSLCLRVLGLEAAAAFQSQADPGCSAFQKNHCNGACLGHESLATHRSRLRAALDDQQVQAWPFEGAVTMAEVSSDGTRRDLHLIHYWCYLGSADSPDALAQLIARSPARPRFDLDTYKILEWPLALGLLKIEAV